MGWPRNLSFIQSIWIATCICIPYGRLGIKKLMDLVKHPLANGCGVMWGRKMNYGGKLLINSRASLREVGGHIWLKDPME